jgi:uncharacterized protein (TIGR02996 family)
MTDDDELEMAIYVFDDHYRKKKPGKADFLLLPGWELPDGGGTGRLPKLPAVEGGDLSGDGDGATYFVCLAYYDSGNLSDLADCSTARRFVGVRVPDVARALLMAGRDEEFDGELGRLRAALAAGVRGRTGEEVGFRAAIRKDPSDVASWSAYSDWLQERGRPAAGLELLRAALAAVKPDAGGRRPRHAAKDLIRITPHMAQACKYTGTSDDGDCFHQWILFDDRWVAAHPALAAGILTFGTRWDVL